MEAMEILGRIIAFSPDEWAASNDAYPEDWLLIGRLYHSTILLFCTSSLRAFLMPIPAVEAKHRAQLFAMLQEALMQKRLKRLIMWSMMVAGFLARDGTDEEQNWIVRELLKIGQDMGTYSPWTGKMVLERFWRSGNTEWDECFDTPRVFMA